MQFIKSTFLGARFCFMCICPFVPLLTFPCSETIHCFWYSWRTWVLNSDQKKIGRTWEAANQCCKVKHVVPWYLSLFCVAVILREWGCSWQSHWEWEREWKGQINCGICKWGQSTLKNCFHRLQTSKTISSLGNLWITAGGMFLETPLRAEIATCPQCSLSKPTTLSFSQSDTQTLKSPQ